MSDNSERRSGRSPIRLKSGETLADALANRNSQPNSMSMPLSDINDLDAVVHALGIEDSDTTPAEAVAELKAEIERLRAGLSNALSGSDDDRAIADFSRAMATKMAISRVKGRDGWQTCPTEALWAMLRGHVEKGDPVDVGNFAMMIWNNLCEKELPPTPRHASAPDGYRCADCAMDGHACPTCYAAWWAKKHPHHRQL